MSSTLTHRSPLPEILQPRRGTEPIIWCAAGGETYIVLTMAYELARNAIPSMLTAAYNEILTGVILHGDSVIPGGMFQKSGTGNAALRIMNSNNHQLTYGVLGAAILALQGYMSDFSFGVASFTIFSEQPARPPQFDNSTWTKTMYRTNTMEPKCSKLDRSVSKRLTSSR